MSLPPIHYTAQATQLAAERYGDADVLTLMARSHLEAYVRHNDITHLGVCVIDCDPLPADYDKVCDEDFETKRGFAMIYIEPDEMDDEDDTPEPGVWVDSFTFKVVGKIKSGEMKGKTLVMPDLDNFQNEDLITSIIEGLNETARASGLNSRSWLDS